MEIVGLAAENDSVFKKVPEWVKFAIVVIGAIAAVIIQGNRFENKIIANDYRSKQNQAEITEMKSAMKEYARSSTVLSNSVSRLAGAVKGLDDD